MSSLADAAAAAAQLRSAAARPPLHATDAEEEDDSVKQLKECAALYLSLQECLAETDRNWRSCQSHVRALKACQARRNHSEQK